MPLQYQFLHLQGAGGTAVPYDRREGRNTTQALATNPQDSIRLKRYEEHWRFYSGIQWNFQREDGAPLVTANYCRRIVDKKASFLLGKGVKFSVPDPLSNITKPIIDEVWDYNDRDQLALEMATMGGVTGDVFVLVVYQPPSNQQKAINPFTKGRIRLRLLGSDQVFPVWNPLNQEELLQVRVITEVADQTSPTTNSTTTTPITLGGIGVQKNKRYIEDIFPDRIVEGWEDGIKQIRSNDLGEIPLVHIQHQKFPKEYYGLSDLDGVIDIQRELNEKLTDISDVINYHASPITIITGASAKNLSKGPRSLWSGLPAEAKVFNLELGSDLPASYKYLESVLQMMLDLSGVPEQALGRGQPISNTSAAALQVGFGPLVEDSERKQPNYRKGFKEINYFILRWSQLAEKTTYPIDLCKKCGGRIVEVQGRDGTKKRKCYLVDPQTLKFMSPDDVIVSMRRQYSFGSETRKLPYSRVKEEHLKKSTSYWDPEKPVDLQKQAEDDKERQQKADAWREEQEEPEIEVSIDGETGEQVEREVPKEAPKQLPKELEPEIRVEPEQLSPYDIDIPEEPERISVTVQSWDPNRQEFLPENLGVLTLVPTGCTSPTYLNPYDSCAEIKSALPRDLEQLSNLYATWQKNGWLNRHEVMRRLEIGENPAEVDKKIADDIPFILAMQGKPDQTKQVAQTAGIDPGQKGSNNGAPLPPGPGPGRGNRYAPGDNMAGRPPSNASPGERMR